MLTCILRTGTFAYIFTGKVMITGKKFNIDSILYHTILPYIFYHVWYQYYTIHGPCLNPPNCPNNIFSCSLYAPPPLIQTLIKNQALHLVDELLQSPLIQGNCFWSLMTCSFLGNFSQLFCSIFLNLALSDCFLLFESRLHILERLINR